MNDKTQNHGQPEPQITQTEFSAGHFVRWIGISLIIVIAITYIAYSLGSNENQRKINRLNRDMEQFTDIQSLESLVEKFQTISSNLELSSNERARLTELLDQMVAYKTNLQSAEDELAATQLELATINEKYDIQLSALKAKNAKLTEQVAEFETAMAYSQGSVKSFSVSLNDSFSLLQEPSSRIGLVKILNSGSAQINVGNALMFFHIGHTLRFRFAPNWLCDVTLVKIDNQVGKVEFEYACELN